MPLHVYGIIDAPEIIGNVPQGHEGDEVVAFQIDNLSAVVSLSTTMSPLTSIEHVLHHEKVLNELMENHSVLPMRFGRICDPKDLVAFVGTHQETIRADLKEICGKGEMALRIKTDAFMRPQKNIETVSTLDKDRRGTAYLLERTKKHQKNQHIRKQLEEIRSCLEGVATRFVWLDSQEPSELFKASCLVRYDQTNAFLASLKTLEERGVQINCTGPWAPYSFVTTKAASGMSR